MRVGDGDVGDGFVTEARDECVDMLGKLGAGVDDRDLALADDIGTGALEGKRPGIARDDAPDARCHPFEPAVFEREFAAIGNVDSHRRSASKKSPWPDLSGQGGSFTSPGAPSGCRGALRMPWRSARSAPERRAAAHSGGGFPNPTHRRPSDSSAGSASGCD